MLPISKRVLIIILFFFCMIHISIQDKDFFYKNAKNIFCADYKQGCSFNISSTFSYSPKIPTDLIDKCGLIMSCKYQIYLKFYRAKENTQIYLMAYETTHETTIISNGDYYKIDIYRSVDQIYQLEIYNEIKNVSYIQFLFLGVQNNHQYRVSIKLETTYDLYLLSDVLDYRNSLDSKNDNILLQIINAYSLMKLAQIERANKIITFLNDIMKQLFDQTISFEIPMPFDSIVTYVPPAIILTMSYSVAFETSTSKFFEPEEFILSEDALFKGKIIRKIDGWELFEKKDNDKETTNFLKIAESYKKQMESIVLEIKLFEDEAMSITVSTNALLNCLFITINFSYDLEFTEINSSIEIKIQFINKLVLESVQTAPAVQYVHDSSIEENKKIIIIGMLSFLTISLAAAAIITTAGAAIPSIAGLVVLPLA